MTMCILGYSAGIGRTGTFIVIDNLVKMIKEQGNVLSIVKCIGQGLKLNCKRPRLLPTLNSFSFSHQDFTQYNF